MKPAINYDAIKIELVSELSIGNIVPFMLPTFWGILLSIKLAHLFRYYNNLMQHQFSRPENKGQRQQPSMA